MSEFRSLFRLARRTARRNLARTILVVLLIAAPVAAAGGAAIAARNVRTTPEDNAVAALGAADVSLSIWNPLPGVVEWARSAIPERIEGDGAVVEWRTAYHRVSIDGGVAVRYTEVLDADLAHPAFAGKFLVSGAVPAGPDEVALSRSLRDGSGTAVGDRVSVGFGDQRRELRVVGEITDPFYLDRAFVVLAPAGFDAVPITPAEDDGVTYTFLVSGRFDGRAFADDFAAARAGIIGSTAPADRPAVLAGLPDPLYEMLSPADVAALVALAPGHSPDELNGFAHDLLDPRERSAGWGFEVIDRAAFMGSAPTSTLEQPPVLGALAAGLILAEVALVAAAAYATGIRRRLREIGLLASAGASNRQVRAVVLGEAAVAGVVAAVLGAAAGVFAVMLGRPLLEAMSGRLIDTIQINPLDLAGPALAGVLAAVAAAWLPARTAARVSTLTALHGRIPLSAPPRWIAPASVALTGFGLFLLLAARDSVGSAGEVLGGLAVVLTIVGAAGLAVPITAVLSRYADRLPATLRLVVRDSGRQRTRAAAAIAALIVVLVAPVVVATALETSARNSATFSLPDAGDQVLVTNLPYDGPATYSATAAQLAEVGQILPEAASFPLEVREVLVETAQVSDVAPSPTSVLFEPLSTSDWDLGVAVPADGFLAAIGLPEAQELLDAGQAIVLGTRHGVLPVRVGELTVDAAMFPAHTVALMPRLLLPPDLAVASGAPVLGTAVAFVNPEDLGSLERAAVDSLQFGASRGYPPPLSTDELQLLSVGIALVVALLIIGMVIALSATESDRDIGVMVAVGAPPRLRRRFLAWQAGYHVALAALLATPVALLLVKVATRGGTITYSRFGVWNTGTVVVPWEMVALVLVGMPLIAAAVTRLAVRSAPTGAPRRVD